MQNKINEPDNVKTDSTNPSQDVVESVKPSFSTVLFNKRNLWLFPVSFIIFVSLWEWIVVYFDIDRDKELRESIKKQKSELITQMLQAKNKGVKTQPVVKKDKVEAHCNTMGVIR